MNFFEHQAKARAQSRWMIWAFAFSVLLTVAGVMAIMAVALAFGTAEKVTLEDAALPHLPALLAVGLGVAVVIGLGSLYKIARLKSGGGAVAVSLGGVLVPPETREPRLRRLRNVVEEIAIASGVPVPQIYVLEREAGINAFAAGYAPADAAVTVTRGALEKLSRDELQGVIAHEFSHVLNGDMRLNIRLMGLIFGLLVIHIIGREIVANTPRGGKRGPTLAVLGFGLMTVGGIGMLCGRLIKARLSRQREYLADASAVQFTRQTGGIAGALKKIAGIDTGSRLDAQKGEEISHMLFGDGVGYSALFATHPPLVERIQRIEPQFKLAAIKTQAVQWNDPGFYSDPGDEGPVKFMAATTRDITPSAIVSQVGHPGADDYRYAETLNATIPLLLRDAAQSDADAPAVLLALLMDADAVIAGQQREAIAKVRGAAEAARVAVLHQSTENLHAALRLPLAALAFPTLRARPPAELMALQVLVSLLAKADGRIGAFEFVLARLLAVQLGDWLSPASAGSSGSKKLVEMQDEAALLLSVVADAGTARGDEARRAFAAGWAHLWPQSTRAAALPPDWPTALDDALKRLDTLMPLAKQMLVEALVKTLAQDGRVTVGEAELLRVTCASLHCPLPPALSGA
ncbi:MAG: M48 family metalloprotease [Stagnimonas sp.]|nr:M48 family metalloprotease [Stagnimonas sp.]